jgi:hypothetical protein
MLDQMSVVGGKLKGLITHQGHQVSRLVLPSNTDVLQTDGEK